MVKKIEFMPPICLRDYFAPSRPAQGSFKDISLTFRGRDAIYLAARHFELEKKHTVLLPGYLCDTVLAGFSGRCHFVYYDIDTDFSISADKIAKLISEHEVRLLYVIHYFGFIHRNLPQLSRLCKNNNVLLWEDHAHSAFSRFCYKYADAMFFSFRKLLPIPDGGGLWIKNVSTNSMMGRKVWLSDADSLSILGKRIMWGVSNRMREIAHMIAMRNVNALCNGLTDISVKPISRLSRRIVCSANVKYIFDVRRKLFRQWQFFLRKSRFRPVFLKLSEDACPQGFPIWVANAEELVERLEAHNVFLKIHWPLPRLIAKKCPISWRISKSIVTLPIYPGLNESDMRKVTALLNTYGKPLNYTTADGFNA